jgi:hypothetical protein
MKNINQSKMKNKPFTLTAILFGVVAGLGLLLISSCEGPAGIAGADGLDGKDANENCVQCHNDEVTVLAAITQASNSGHQMGTAFERNGTDCAVCHTHQGFLEHLQTGDMATAADISNPLPQGCRTCHYIHNNYDVTDFALRATEPVELMISGVEVDMGTSNACITCHQPRVPGPFPVSGGADVSITSSRWGPHHGAQTSMVYGTGGYEIAGSVTYPSTPGSHPHAGAGCVTCHMSEPFGAFAGGHSFSMSYEYHGSETEHLVSCEVCHDPIDSFDLNGASTDVLALVEELKAILITEGIYNETTGLLNASSGTPLVLSPDKAGAVLNFLLVEEDGSHGVHNSKYITALLQNSIEVFN